MRLTSLHTMCGVTAVAMMGSCAVAGAAPLQPGSQTEKWIDLRVGECVTDLPPADGSRVNVTVVDCATAHLAEVYLRAPMAVDAAIATVANRDCAAGFAPYTGQSLAGSRFSITPPRAPSSVCCSPPTGSHWPGPRTAELSRRSRSR
jgi:hypothetical protein